MFYSHDLLVRKGPLCTVWRVSHLDECKLKIVKKKGDIDPLLIHVPSTVERIMYPEVPIALRMSAYLLWGIVLIYSKKVDHLYEDYTDIVKKSKNSPPANVNLAEDANQAQYNAITLPDTYALDALVLDEDFPLTQGFQDNHLKSIEEITLSDQYHAVSGRYVRITIDDETFPDSVHTELREDDLMQIDNPTEVPIPMSPDVRDAGRSPDIPNPDPNLDIPIVGLNKSEERQGMSEGESIPPLEIMRDYQGSDVNLPSPILRPHQENFDLNLINKTPSKDTAEKKIDTPMSLHASPLVLSERSLQFEETSPANTEDLVISGSLMNVSSTELQLIPSPTRISTPMPEQPKPKRKRKQLFDKSLVLSNKFVKDALNNCSNLVKKRKELPCSALEQWRFRENKERKNNTELFSEPLIIGMCDDLQNLSRKALNPKLLVIEEHQLESRIAVSSAHVSNVEETQWLPSSDHEIIPDVGEETERISSRDCEAAHVSDDNIETERLRSPDQEPRINIEQNIPPSPLQYSAETHGTAETSSTLRVPSSFSEPRYGTTDPRSDLGMFTDSTVFDMEMSLLHSEERNEAVGTASSDIPESTNSMNDELSFLELDNSSISDSSRAHTGNMSARTRVVAQYLKNHSPLSQFPAATTDLSLNSILEGRPRKLCARMFYEITVLKSEGLIQVQQDEPYGDITLKLTSDNLDKP